MRGRLKTKVSCCVLVLVTCYVAGSAQESSNRNQDQSLTQPIQRFDPAHQKALSYSDDSLQVTLVVAAEHNSLKVLNPTTKREILVNLPFEMAQVDEIRGGLGGRLVVRGMVNASGSEIVIVDPRSNKLVDKFLCYLPSPSPDGRYIAFIKFYPMHFAGNTEDHYMLYDLSKGSKENRPSGFVGDDKNVGAPIYPLQIGNKVGDNVELSNGFVHHAASAGFFWKPDSTQLVFADRLESENEISLILVDIDVNRRITIRTVEQPDDPLCSLLKDPQQKLSCNLLVRKVDFHSAPESALTIWFEIVNIQKVLSYEFRLSQFK
jgi:hypothetical protein